MEYNKCPFPWFGGKRNAAEAAWEFLGDVSHYVEPFAGSLAVLLNRPHPCNRTHFSETVNDLDGWLVNFWRAVQWAPEAVASAASWPVAEADIEARQLALIRWRGENLARLQGDAAWYCPVMAGWWAWSVSGHIGCFDAKGPWIADPATGRIFKQGKASREPGVSVRLPHLTGDGRGVNRPNTREPGVLDPITPAHGESALDSIDWGATFHDRTMPELVRWMRYLCARIRHVRIVNGDWTRVVTSGAAKTLPVRQKQGVAGIFLDPPYADTAGRRAGLYSEDCEQVAHAVREWCLANGDDPDYRIVLAGYDGEHGDALTRRGWVEREWFKAGFLTGGMRNIAGSDCHQQAKERLWASPHCLKEAVSDHYSLFGAAPSAGGVGDGARAGCE